MFIPNSFRFSINQATCLGTNLSTPFYLPIYLCICLSTCLSVHLRMQMLRLPPNLCLTLRKRCAWHEICARFCESAAPATFITLHSASQRRCARHEGGSFQPAGDAKTCGGLHCLQLTEVLPDLPDPSSLFQFANNEAHLAAQAAVHAKPACHFANVKTVSPQRRQPTERHEVSLATCCW